MDVVAFLAIVVVVAAVGIALGMIVAGRIDRIIAPAPDAVADAGTEAPEPVEPMPANHEEEQLS